MAPAAAEADPAPGAAAARGGARQDDLGDGPPGVDGATSQQKQQLQAQLSLLAVPKEGDGVGRVENDEATPQPHLTILEDIDSPEVMVAFLSATLAQDEEEKTQLQGQLKNQMAHCLCLAQLARLAPRSESNCVWGGGRVSRPYRYPWRSCRATSWRSNRRSWHHGNT
jgi:hypothetical protein